MSLLNKLNKSHLFRNLVYYPLVAGLISLSSCTKDSSNPSGPSGGGNGGGGNNGGYVEDSGNTNYEGELGLKVNGQKFDVYVKDEDENNLNNIKVSGAYFQDGVYGFLAEDFTYDYFSNIIYKDLNSASSTDGIDGIRINHVLNEVRGREYKKKDISNETYVYNLSNNLNLTFLGIVASDELYNFYEENDAILNNISILEFITDNFNAPSALSFALEAAQFREKILNNQDNYSDIINNFVDLFGLSYEKEALYFDVYKNRLGVLTHQTSRSEYATVRGEIQDEDLNGVSMAFVNIIEGPSSGSSYSDDNGIFFIKYLNPGGYTFRGSASGFIPCEVSKRINFLGYTTPKCNELFMYLNLERHVTLDTLILQPGPSEGKDASVLSLNPTTNYGDGDFLNATYNPWGNGDIWRSYLFLDISTIPQNSTIRSAKLFMRGTSGQEGEGLDDAYVAIKRVLDNWNESQINWNNQPRFDSHTYAVSIFSHWPSYEWKSFDLVDLIQGWVNNRDNKGIAIVLDQESGRRTAAIYSSDISNADFRYKVEVIYEH